MRFFGNKQTQIDSKESISILQTTLDSINDGVLVVSRMGKIITYNNKFLELWAIPESLVELRDDNRLLMFVHDQLKRPDEFIELVNLAYANPEKHVNDILEFKDGRFFERYSQPQRVENEIVGRIWCFRDITVRKKYEEEIKNFSVNLENMVAERTNQLQEANIELEETNELLDKEIFERKKVEEAVKRLNSELEDKVMVRTLLLENINTELREEIVERKKVETALRNNLQLIQTLIDSIQYPIVYKNTNGLFLGYNKAYENLFGAAEEFLIGKTTFDIRPKEIAEKHHNVDLALLNKMGCQIYDSSEPDKYGVPHDFSVAKSTFQNADGSIAGIVATMIDVTEKNKMDNALKESEERFRATFEQAAVGIVHATLEGKFIRVNQKFCDIVGYSQDELLKMTFMEITYQSDLNKDVGLMDKLLCGEINTFSMEKRYYRKDHSIVWANLTVSLIKQPSGELINAMGVVEDISERKHSEELIKSSEYTFRMLFEGSSDAIFIIEDSKVIDCNQAFVELLEYASKDDILGKSPWDFSLTEQPDGRPSKEKALEILKKAKAEGKHKFEWWHKKSDNTLLIVEVMLTSIMLDGKNVFHALLRDIGERKQMEQKLEYLSYHDQLTGLYNRRFYEEELKRLDLEENLPISIIIADVNGLKLVNDSFGHIIGDELLMKVAEAMRKVCRANDTIARLGGDEFVILLPKTDTYEADLIVKRIKAMSQKEKIASIEVSVSFGYSTKNNLEDNIRETFIKAEDEMYKIKLFESPSMRGKTVNTIISTLHEKNKREEQHSHRVSELCKSMGSALCLSEREVEELKTVGLLHDIGKIAIEEDILNKAGKLTNDEWKEIVRHPEIGYRILGTVSEMSDMANYVLAHHEKWNGTGYPKGLKGEEIPVQARIIAIADAYDAMTSERSYRDPLSEDAAIEELERNAGSQFDPMLTKVFIEKVLISQ